MTNEKTQQWAREAGLTPPFLCGGTSAISDFATLVRNATLEEAALRFDGIDTGGAGYFAEESSNIIRDLKS